VGVCCTLVRRVGQDDWGFLVGYVVDCKRILVVAVADLMALKLLVWSAVDETLSVVYVAVF
jgi:hypothetical protein